MILSSLEYHLSLETLEDMFRKNILCTSKQYAVEKTKNLLNRIKVSLYSYCKAKNLCIKGLGHYCR
jgi:hypothetical protein